MSSPAATAPADPPFPLAPHFTICRAQPSHFDGFGRGMRCTAPVKMGEELLAIPVAKCWTADNARNCPELARLGDEVLEAISDATLIALHILVVRAQKEAANEACRREHVALLASAEFETLMDWDEEDLQLLTGSKWKMVAQACREDIEEEFVELQEVIGDFLAAHCIDMQSFLWAHKVLVSRSVQIFMEDGSMLNILGPGQDMFNHSAEIPVNNEDMNITCSHGTGEQLLVIRAYKDFEAGQQALISYSGASNGRLLMMAGFTIPGNPFDAVELAFTFPVTPASLELYLKLAEGLDAGIRTPGSAVVEETKAEFLETLPHDAERPEEVVLHIRLSRGALPAQLERVLAFFRLGGLCRGSAAAPTAEALAACDADAAGRASALKQVRGSLQAMLAPYARGLPEERGGPAAAEAAGGGSELKARRRLNALHMLAGEEQIFREALGILDRKLDDSRVDS